VRREGFICFRPIFLWGKTRLFCVEGSPSPRVIYDEIAYGESDYVGGGSKNDPESDIAVLALFDRRRKNDKTNSWEQC